MRKTPEQKNNAKQGNSNSKKSIFDLYKISANKKNSISKNNK